MTKKKKKGVFLSDGRRAVTRATMSVVKMTTSMAAKLSRHHREQERIDQEAEDAATLANAVEAVSEESSEESSEDDYVDIKVEGGNYRGDRDDYGKGGGGQGLGQAVQVRA